MRYYKANLYCLKKKIQYGYWFGIWRLIGEQPTLEACFCNPLFFKKAFLIMLQITFETTHYPDELVLLKIVTFSTGKTIINKSF